jgi:hypothetical protein
MELCPFCQSPARAGDQTRRITFGCGTFRFADRDGPRRSELCRIGELVKALEESVKLQSHYAVLLNGWDGGQRRPFGSAAEWLERLRECRLAAAQAK